MSRFRRLIAATKVVDVPVLMQQQVPQVQTVLKTVEVTPVQFVCRVAKVPAIMQVGQCRRSRRRTRSSWSIFTNRSSIIQMTKHVDFPQILYIGKVAEVPVVVQRQVPQIRDPRRGRMSQDIRAVVSVNGLTHVTTKLRASGDEPWLKLKPVPPTGSSEETPSVSPAVWAKEEPAKNPSSSPRPSADERPDAGEDQDGTSMPRRSPRIPPPSAEETWPTLKRDGHSVLACPTGSFHQARKMTEVNAEGVNPFPSPFQPFPCPQQQGHDPRVTGTLTKPMGMILDSRPCGTGPFVTKLADGSAAQSGQVRVGDVLLCETGRDVLSYSLQEVVEAIRAVPQGVTLQSFRATEAP